MSSKEAADKRVAMKRPKLATTGERIQLVTNHFKVNHINFKDDFYHYRVDMKYEDGHPIVCKRIGPKVIDNLPKIYETSLGDKGYAYDGENSLFILGRLPYMRQEFDVLLEDLVANKMATLKGNDSPSEGDRKRMKRPCRTKTIKVELKCVAQIPMTAIAQALRGEGTDNSQEALRVLDIILRQHAAKKGCLLVKQSFFQNKPLNFVDIRSGIMACPGFHSSFRTTQGGLSLNIGVTSTMIVKPGPVIDFLTKNQNVNHLQSLDWTKAKRILKNLRIKTFPNNQEFRITGLSDLPCYKQLFTLKKSGLETEISVYDYFIEKYPGIQIGVSRDLPCIKVGKPTKPTYFPLEVCDLISLQRYTKALSGLQRSKFVQNSRQKPQERMDVLSKALKDIDYSSDPVLQAGSVSISTQFTPVVGRTLQAPKLKMGDNQVFIPRNGRWNFMHKKLFRTIDIYSDWVVVDFSGWDNRNLVQKLINCARLMGIKMGYPKDIIIEEGDSRRGTYLERVNAMLGKMHEMFRERRPKFALCILPEPKKSDIYGPWKRRCLFDIGIISQCIAPTKANTKNLNQYLANVLLKINAKLGGMNSVLHDEYMRSIPHVSRAPTIIIGMDVSHPGQHNIPSIAAVVSSCCWPYITQYRASVSTQSPNQEMVDSLFMPQNIQEVDPSILDSKSEEKKDDGIIRELLIDFYRSSNGRKPENIIIFRDGVSESQFNQVLNIELDQIKKACEFLQESWSPKFTLLVAQKNHHTRFFTKDKSGNVPAGTVVDTTICHPRNYDFYMCSHAGMIGTTRPTHYHVLLDEIGFAPDDLQNLVHSLSYVYQRSSTAISVVAPIFYADLAASQIRVSMSLDEVADAASASTAYAAYQLPKLHEYVRSSMFFC